MLKFATNLIISQLLDVFRVRRKPRVIQMPITGRCNSRCVTCNVWKVRNNKDIDPIYLKKILSQPYFSKVKTIGINGGELTLVNNLEEIIDAVLSVKSLTNIHVISNGLLPDRLLLALEMIKKKSEEKGVKVGFTLSVDGVSTVHDMTRGVPNAFVRTENLLNTFNNNWNQYCDDINIGCTISKTNVPYIRQTSEYLKKYPFKVYYHLAVPNKRIHTFNDADYYVIGDERSRMLAMEFFQNLFFETSLRSSPIEKFRAFANYYFLKNRGSKRLAQCIYRNRDITIDENLDLSYCATASDTIGSLKDNTPEKLLKSDRGRKIHKEIEHNCKTCVHYSDNPTIKGLFIFTYHLLKNRFFQGTQYKYIR